jgi:hypothetical protein
MAEENQRGGGGGGDGQGESSMAMAVTMGAGAAADLQGLKPISGTLVVAQVCFSSRYIACSVSLLGLISLVLCSFA